jgi:hypothetical protein
MMAIRYYLVGFCVGLEMNAGASSLKSLKALMVAGGVHPGEIQVTWGKINRFHGTWPLV